MPHDKVTKRAAQSVRPCKLAKRLASIPSRSLLSSPEHGTLFPLRRAWLLVGRWRQVSRPLKRSESEIGMGVS